MIRGRINIAFATSFYELFSVDRTLSIQATNVQISLVLQTRAFHREFLRRFYLVFLVCCPEVNLACVKGLPVHRRQKRMVRPYSSCNKNECKQKTQNNR